MDVLFIIEYYIMPRWWATADKILSDEQIKQELDLDMKAQFGGVQLY